MCGVPQGSVSSPKLFILYMIFIVSFDLKFLLFAGDINLYCSGISLESLKVKNMVGHQETITAGRQKQSSHDLVIGKSIS